MRSYVRAGVSVLACYGAGFIGSLFVTAASLSWYDGIAKPFFNPPAWLFAPVWLVLYGCMACALALMWRADPSAKEGVGWVPLFFAHLLLNAAWTVFFFGFHAVFFALIDIVILLWCIVLLCFGAIAVDRRAAYFLLPYMLWVAYATILNASIWYLN